MFCCFRLLHWKGDFSCRTSDTQLLYFLPRIPLSWIDVCVWYFLTVCLLIHTTHCWTDSLYKPLACLLLMPFHCVCFSYAGVFTVPLPVGSRHVSQKVNVSFSCVVRFVVDRCLSLWKGMPVVRWLYALRQLRAGVVLSAFETGSSWINHHVSGARIKDMKTSTVKQ